ncbi:MAG: response regulator [Pseudomonadota bacterium]
MSLKEKLRVLVVDDLSASRALVYNCFDMMGVKNIMAAKNGVDALEAIKKSPVHIVISDYNMPGMDGLQLLQAIRSNPKTARTGFILVTGSQDKALIDKGRKLGMNNYLAKPFNPRDLERCIERVVGKLS